MIKIRIAFFADMLLEKFDSGTRTIHHLLKRIDKSGAINDLVANTSRANYYGQEGHDCVLKSFSWDKMVREYYAQFKLLDRDQSRKTESLNYGTAIFS